MESAMATIRIHNDHFLASTVRRSVEARKWSLCILMVAIADSIANYFMHYLLEISGQCWVDTVRLEAFRCILDQPRNWFDDEKNLIAHLAENLDHGPEEMRNLIGRFAGFVLVAISMMGIAIMWSFVVCWKLTIVGLAVSPFVYFITKSFSLVSSRWEIKSNEAASN